eukprot:TRINITY_DN3601_c0_g1_i2.p1 TRINITY_DN3601_c0_g1~~TRINITY_DN3601_c0_g1_i2.p1  ORF type:complete len:723 (-),score=112.52 TRINITY_DN3601_c0_g1_i2:120-2288(-)
MTGGEAPPLSLPRDQHAMNGVSKPAVAKLKTRRSSSTQASITKADGDKLNSARSESEKMSTARSEPPEKINTARSESAPKIPPPRKVSKNNSADTSTPCPPLAAVRGERANTSSLASESTLLLERTDDHCAAVTEAVGKRVTEIMTPLFQDLRDGLREDMQSALKGVRAGPPVPASTMLDGFASARQTWKAKPTVRQPPVQLERTGSFSSHGSSRWSKGMPKVADAEHIGALLNGTKRPRRFGTLVGDYPRRQVFMPIEEYKESKDEQADATLLGSDMALVPTSSQMFPHFSADVERCVRDVDGFDLHSDEENSTCLIPHDTRQKVGTLQHGSSTLGRLHELCSDFMKTRGAHSMVAMLVLLNSLSIGVQTEYESTHLMGDRPTFFLISDILFCMAFSFEMSLRMFVLRAAFFYEEDAGWNLFDLSVLLLSFVDLVIDTSPHDSGKMPSKVSVIIRLLRFVRIARLFRILRFLDEMRTIVVCVLGAMRSLAWTLLLLAMLIYVVAICLTQVVIDHRKDADTSESLILWYGSLARTCLTLYESITSGLSWDEAIRPLIGEISPFLGILFTLYIAFTVFALLNVVTGVFVENAMDSAETDKRESTITKICDLFKRTDNDGSGEVTWEEFQTTLQSEDMQDYFKSIDVDISEAKGLYELLDADSSGSIDAVEFVSGCVRLTGPAKAFDAGLLLFETRNLKDDLLAQIEVLHGMFEKILHQFSIRS